MSGAVVGEIAASLLGHRHHPPKYTHQVLDRHAISFYNTLPGNVTQIYASASGKLVDDLLHVVHVVGICVGHPSNAFQSHMEDVLEDANEHAAGNLSQLIQRRAQLRTRAKHRTSVGE